MRDVILGNTARDDLQSIFNWLEPDTGATFARDYVRQIRDKCHSLANFPNRGELREDLAPDLRTIPFKRKATIAYKVDGNKITVLRILHHGRNPGRAFAD